MVSGLASRRIRRRRSRGCGRIRRCPGRPFRPQASRPVRWRSRRRRQRTSPSTGTVDHGCAGGVTRRAWPRRCRSRRTRHRRRTAGRGANRTRRPRTSRTSVARDPSTAHGRRFRALQSGPSRSACRAPRAISALRRDRPGRRTPRRNHLSSGARESAHRPRRKPERPGRRPPRQCLPSSKAPPSCRSARAPRQCPPADRVVVIVELI